MEHSSERIAASSPECPRAGDLTKKGDRERERETKRENYSVYSLGFFGNFFWDVGHAS